MGEESWCRYKPAASLLLLWHWSLCLWHGWKQSLHIWEVRVLFLQYSVCKKWANSTELTPIPDSRAHSMSITGCAYSTHSRFLLTASVDTESKSWYLIVLIFSPCLQSALLHYGSFLFFSLYYSYPNIFIVFVCHILLLLSVYSTSVFKVEMTIFLQSKHGVSMEA